MKKLNKKEVKCLKKSFDNCEYIQSFEDEEGLLYGEHEAHL